jgi:hypothetical protein
MIVWAAVSMFIVGYSYLHDKLLFGLVAIYGIMLLIFLCHIFKMKKNIRNTVSVYGIVTGYTETLKGRGFLPIVKYTTEDGREVTATYSVQNKEKQYETGSEELICYDPADPMFFFFAGREDELFRDYVQFLFIGGVIAVFLLIFALAKLV